MTAKNLIGLFLMAAMCLYSHTSFAQSNNSASTLGTESEAANFGIYNWDESSETWVLLYSGYDEFYATEALGDGDYLVEPIPVPAGGPGAGGGMNDEIAQKSRVPAVMATDEEEEPKDLEPVVVTGVRPSMLGGSMLSVFWRGGIFERVFGQRSSSTKKVPAPDLPPQELDQVTCNDDIVVKRAAATKVAARYGMKPHTHRGQRLRIGWRTGAEETYLNIGIVGSMWMEPVPGTCRDAP